MGMFGFNRSRKFREAKRVAADRNEKDISKAVDPVVETTVTESPPVVVSVPSVPEIEAPHFQDSKPRGPKRLKE